MPDNTLAPPDMPWLFPRSPLGPPNGLGPPMLNYAAPPPDTTQGAGVAAAGQQAWQALPSWPSVEEQRQMLAPLPGWQGTAVDAAKQWADAVMMGTTAPGEVPPPGILAYHGSPADFNRFDDRFIGTGEGAQAYGRGHYFGGVEETARSYRVSTSDASATVGGDPYDATNINHVASYYLHELGGGDRAATLQRISDESNQMQAKIDNLKSMYPTATDEAVIASPYVTAKQRLGMIRDLVTNEKQPLEPYTPPGHMYQVNIGADPEHFLDWDKPLSEQHPKVQEQLADVLRFQKVPPKSNVGAETTGGLMMQYLEDRLGKPDAANELASSGVPGIRYLDQGSRGAGQGTHNYVVFDPATIEILRKYGIAGLIAGGGAAAAGTQQQQPSQ